MIFGDRPIEIQKPKFKNSSPIAWTIAGSDSGGGAGVQADLKAMNAFGVHGCSVITTLTAQNTLGVDAVEAVSDGMLHAQLDTLRSDLPPAVIKTGMLGNTSCCQIVADFLEQIQVSGFKFQNSPALVCDPVLASTSGTPLLENAALSILINNIFPNVTVLTPNLPETETLLGAKIQDIEDAAKQILKLGVESVLIKGGHGAGDECRDYWTNGTESMWLSSPRIDTRNTHGTGCILASAIASAMALGQDIPEAVITAKTFLNQCLKSPAHVGGGQGLMTIRPFENREEDRPTIQ